MKFKKKNEEINKKIKLKKIEKIKKKNERKEKKKTRE